MKKNIMLPALCHGTTATSVKSILGIALISFAIIAGACKKSKSESVTQKLAGKWKTVSHGYDANGNSTIDADENTAASDSPSVCIILNEDGTGSSLNVYGSHTDTTLTFTWSLTNNNTDIVTTRKSGNSGFINLTSSSTVHIADLSTTTLRLTIVASGSGLNWNNYQKQ